ncbi:MAG TPA: hypothetical protein VH116_06560, partial [Gemmatimonadales bacterium]|nr:hypothetical protein [Gemmatimonadales bacterium]
AVALLTALHLAQRDALRIDARRFDGLATGPALRRAILRGTAAGAIARAWQPELARFRRMRAQYLLY